ncbi:hypothetical protein H4R34_001518 [Dimargaris verticillata]|uniref:Peptidase A1 domain-containing protein n=1 Tax=Dimargaris verticillata TaxID=2761393 RepID=A0A9W8BB90_9FUNG|nr:hypothetical protein H4R34_001518 [Dimargaris verticillata]
MLSPWWCSIAVLALAPLGLTEELRLPLTPALRRVTNQAASKSFFPKTSLAKHLPRWFRAKKSTDAPSEFPLTSVYTTTLQLGSPPRKFIFAIHPYALGFSLLAKVAEASCGQLSEHFCDCSTTCKVVQGTLMAADEINDQGQVITDRVQLGSHTWADFPLQLLTRTQHPLFDMYNVDGYIGLQPFADGSVLSGGFIHFLSMKANSHLAIRYDWAHQGPEVDLVIETPHTAPSTDLAEQRVPQDRVSFFFGLGAATGLTVEWASNPMIVIPQLPTFVNIESQAILLPMTVATQLHRQLLQVPDESQLPPLQNNGYLELNCLGQYSPVTLFVGKLAFKFTFPDDFIRMGQACYSPFAATQSPRDTLQGVFGLVEVYGKAVGLGQHFLRKHPITMTYGFRDQGSTVSMRPFSPMRAYSYP